MTLSGVPAIKHYPAWVVLHVPHDSTCVPAAVRGQFILDDCQLATELDRMTDHHTRALFAATTPASQVIRAPVSRLVVDVERFARDQDEPMAERGMGCVYTATSQCTPLRHRLDGAQREALIQAYYQPHHERLEAAVARSLERYGQCLVIDCHSFPDVALPYERAAADARRPDICIGTDAFHTSDRLANAFVTAFASPGWQVGINDPFAGAIVPASRYRRDGRVAAVMVEINRRLYLDGSGAMPHPTFEQVARQVRQCCAVALEQWESDDQ